MSTNLIKIDELPTEMQEPLARARAAVEKFDAAESAEGRAVHAVTEAHKAREAAALARQAAAREAADAIFAAIEAGATQEQVAASVGKSQPWISNMLQWRRKGAARTLPFAESSKAARVKRSRNISREPATDNVVVSPPTAPTPEVPAPMPEPATTGALAEFQFACRQWLPKMTDSEKSEAVAYAIKIAAVPLRIGRPAS